MPAPGGKAPVHIEYDPRLVEAAVLLRVAGDREEIRFYRARDLIYEIDDPEEREERFRRFHTEWFLRLRMGQPVREALTEQAEAIQQVRRCCVLGPASASEEGADLHELHSSRPEQFPFQKALLIQLKAERLLDPTALQAWLRRELMHIADILDPGYGYERSVPSADAGPAYTNLLKDRYRVLWSTWVDGRLFQRGWLPEGVRQKRWEEFAAAFPGLGVKGEAKFQEFFDSAHQTHGDLMAFARHPESQRDGSENNLSGPQTCPLCRFPVYNLLGGAAELTEKILEKIRGNFPNWLPEHGLCLQCADLYRAMEMSAAAAAVLPRA